MLILTRRLGESLVINGDVVLTVLSTDGLRVRLGVKAPEEVNIRREELPPRPVPAKPK